MTDSNTTDSNVDASTNKLSEHLRLVDFGDTDPDTLQQQVITEINNANLFLDNLESLDKVELKARDQIFITTSQALRDIIRFDHVNLNLDRSWGILSHLNSVMSNDDIRRVHHELLPKLSAFGTRVGQHKPLFNRYFVVAEDKAFFDSLEPARQRAITLALQRFELSGVALSAEKQAQYADIQSRLSSLSASFSDNVLDATQAFTLPLEEWQLSGITESGRALLKQAAEQYRTDNEGSDTATDNVEFLATLNIPVYLAIMTHADDRELREQMYRAYVTRASEQDAYDLVPNEHKAKRSDDVPFNNAKNMAHILDLRAKKAALLGFNNYAELSLSTKMADSVAVVDTFLRNLADKAKPYAKQDLAQLTNKAQSLGISDLQPWDMAYMAEKIKQDKFKLSQEEIRPYFPLPIVIDGLFTIVNRLYGIRAVDHSKDVSLWHDDVRFYQLYDADDTLIGGFYFDLFARTGKRAGAWMSGFQSRYHYINGGSQTNKNNADDSTVDIDDNLDTDFETDYQQLPVCFMVGNFTPPTGGNDAQDKKPSLLTHNEVLTLFHEFGHGLHHLLTSVTVGDVAGVNGVEWDAVELPSQIMENWAWDAEGIELISAHVDTGEPLPQDKLEALLNAKNFQSGMQTLRQIEFSLFDLLIHAERPAPDYQGILDILDSVREQVAVMPTPDYNRFANGFSHIFAGGYAAGYYSYKWAELLSADAFSKFEEEGIFNPETGNAFRQSVLSIGGSLPAKTNFETFRGRPASIDALLRHSGFTIEIDVIATK